MIRIDKIGTLALYGCGIRKRIASLPKVPILMYHSVINGQPRQVAPYFSTETTIKRFEEQIKALRNEGFESLTMKDFVSKSYEESFQRFVVLTFDDGFEDFFTNAFPVLKKYRYTSTVYLPTDKIGVKDNGLEGKAHMTWEQIQKLCAYGVEVGSHTAGHPQLVSCDIQQVKNELQRSKAVLEQNLDQKIYSFAYPYAFPEQDLGFTKYLIDTLQGLEYQSNATTIIGTASAHANPFLMPRLPINDWDNPAFFRAKLAGAYDWMHGLQLVKKNVRPSGV